MIELTGLKKVRERQKKIAAMSGDVTTILRGTDLMFAEEQFQSDLRVIVAEASKMRQDIDEAFAPFGDDYKFGYTVENVMRARAICKGAIKDFISAIDSALEVEKEK